MRDALPEVNNLMDTASLAVVLGTISNILPPVAAFLAIVWTIIRIYEWFRVRVLGKPNDGATK